MQAGGRAGRARRQPRGGARTAEKLRRHADGVARTFVDLFVEEIWEPFDKAGRPEEDWPKMREALDRMRPLAADALLAIFQIAMGEATEKASERTLRLAARPSEAQRQARKSARRLRREPRRPAPRWPPRGPRRGGPRSTSARAAATRGLGLARLRRE